MKNIKEDDIVIITNWYSDLFGKLGRIVKEPSERSGHYVVEFKKKEYLNSSSYITRLMYHRDFAVLKPNKHNM